MEERLVVDFFTEERTHWWHMAKRALISEFVKGSRLNILIGGLGGGLICQELKEKGNYVVGLDISWASCKYVYEKMGIPVVNGDLEGFLPFAKGSFDVVIIADVLEHLDKDRQLLKEVFSALKPKGVAIITVPAYQHMSSPWDVRLQHKRRYSLGAIRREVLTSGFKIQKASYFHMLLYPFVYLYRIILHLPKENGPGRSDFSVFPSPVVSKLFIFYYQLERFLLKIVNLPFGLSIFVVGVKRG